MADLMQDRCDTEVQDADNRQLRCVRPPGHDGYHWFGDRPVRETSGGGPS
jgi:hypothetical protein